MEDFLFRLDSNGPTRLDLAPVLKIAYSLTSDVAPNIWALESLARTNTFTLRLPSYGPCRERPVPDPAPFCGSVEVDFKIEGDHLTPLGRRYIP